MEGKLPTADERKFQDLFLRRPPLPRPPSLPAPHSAFWDTMTDQKNHDPPATKKDPQVDVKPTNAREMPLPSASSADDLRVNLGDDASPVSKLVDIYDSETVDPVYQAKSHAVSCAIQEIGMGGYQVRSLYRVR